MEYKHFSHKHGLILHQLPQGSELTCSGCHLPGKDTIYACWECMYFLHEQCFNATRAMNHPSHPPHPLTLAPFPTYPSNSFYCNSCKLIGTGFSYSCTTCEFDMHIHCAYMHNYNTTHDQLHYHNHSQHPTFPNQNPGSIPHFNEQPPQNSGPPEGYPSINGVTKLAQTKTHGITHFSHPDPLLLCTIEKEDPVTCTCCDIQIPDGVAYSCTKLNCNFYLHTSCFDFPGEILHKSHPKHPLKLLARSPYKNGEFGCNACSRNGKGFTYHCLVCSYDLHVDCASLPENVQRNDHEHPLRLLYTNPIKHAKQEGMLFSCDVCDETVHESCWVYLCKKCDFGTHLECINSVEQEQAGESNQALEMWQLEMNKATIQAALDLWD